LVRVISRMLSGVAGLGMLVTVKLAPVWRTLPANR
jgi:hypothetical protein